MKENERTGRKGKEDPPGGQTVQVCVCQQQESQRVCNLRANTTGCDHAGLTCCCGHPVTKEPGLAAWDDLEVWVLRGRWQVLGSGSQECVKVLQPCDLKDRKHYQMEKVKHKFTAHTSRHLSTST